MASLRSKVATPEETAAIILDVAVKRGVEQAKSKIVGILGRQPPFTRVHLGRTDADLGTTPQVRQGYSLSAIFSSSQDKVVTAVAKSVGEWLQACHGKRFEAEPAKAAVKPGAKTLYIAVAYGEAPAAAG